MTIEQVLELSPHLTTQLLEEAYHYVINKISLPMVVIPVLARNIIDIRNLKDTYGNDIKIKELLDISVVEYETNPGVINLAIDGNTLCGNFSTLFQQPYGLPQDDFNSANKDTFGQTITPKLYQMANKFYITNMDKFDRDSYALVYITGYTQPPLCSHNNAYSYSFHSMPNDSEIDPILAVLLVIKSLAIFFTLNNEIETANAYDDLLVRYFMLYNNNNFKTSTNQLSTIGNVRGYNE